MVTKTQRNRPLSSSLLAVGGAALFATFSGCGGGGSGAVPTGTELSFSVAWEQPVPAAASVAGDAAGTAARAFDTPIPPSVSAIRFIFRPATGSACCIVVPRGSQAFIDRHLVLANVPEGLGTLQINGFPTTFAPSDGVATTCATRPPGGGVACGGDPDTLPSFGSDATEVDVIRGERTSVSVDVYSMPFLLGLTPPDGGTADSARPSVDFTVVDANHFINPAVNIRVKDGAVTDFPSILTSEECLDGDSTLPDCSQGGLLEVHGRRITSEPTQNLPAGTANLRIRADNLADPVRSMESNTVFNVEPPVTTTTTTTTSSSSTTTLPPQTFCLRFSLSDAQSLLGLSYDVDYGSSGGNFTGSGDQVSCTALLPSGNVPTLTTFNDDDGASVLHTAIASGGEFAGPVGLAECEFAVSPPLNLDALPVQVTEATAPDLSSVNANVTVEEIPCP